MKLEGFKEFYFFGTEDKKKELIKIHERNGCPAYSSGTYRFNYVCFEAGRSVGDASDFKRSVDYKTYAEAKAYLLSFAKPVTPVKVAKPKRKKLEIISVHTIDGVEYRKGFADNDRMEHLQDIMDRARIEIKNIQIKQRHYRIAEKRGF